MNFCPRNLPPNNGNLWYQQDGATAHTAVISIVAHSRLFPQRVISRFGDVPWPPRSPDLTAPDFILWGYLKSKDTVLATQTYVRSKKTCGNEIDKSSDETLQDVMRTFVTRVHLCIAEGKRHRTQKMKLCLKNVNHHSKL